MPAFLQHATDDQLNQAIAWNHHQFSLAKLALDGGVYTSLKDGEHQSLALGWAHFFRREALIRLIESYS